MNSSASVKCNPARGFFSRFLSYTRIRYGRLGLTDKEGTLRQTDERGSSPTFIVAN